MNYYFEIQLRKKPGVRENVALNQVYSKLHQALHDLSSDDIGVSFPRYQFKLGDLLRMHSSQERLAALIGGSWLGADTALVCDISGLLEVPAGAQYRTVSRVQANQTPAKLRRLIKRQNLSAADVKAYKAKMYQAGLSAPYVELRSTSTGQLYRRYFEFGLLVDEPTRGRFDTFGVSPVATIPWF